MAPMFSVVLTIIAISAVSGNEESCYYQNRDGQCFERMVAPEIDYSLNELDQNDPKLIQIIKDRYLIPPPDAEKNPMELPEGEVDTSGQFGQVKILEEKYTKVTTSGLLL